MKKYFRKHWMEVILLVILMVFVISMTILRSVDPENEIRWAFIEAVGTITSILLAGLGIIYESRAEGRLQEAQFILDINNTYTTNKEFSDVYMYLENEMFESDEYKEAHPGEPNPYKVKGLNPAEPMRVHISNYLTFFESIYLLIEQKTIDISKLDNLFGYRFFLAVHNEMVQKKKLVGQPGNFKNIYKLEKLWMEYRLKNGGPESIVGYENRLEVVCERNGKAEEYKRLFI